MANRKEFIDDFQEGLRLAIENYLAHSWGALPCIVSNVNLESQTVEVQPTIRPKVIADDGSVSDVTIPVLGDVPIVWPRAGGFALTFPVAIGDECLVVFGSRCIDSWWQLGGVQNQIDQRMHDLSDGFAILAPTSQPNKISNISTDCVQLRNNDGDVYIEICQNGNIKVKSTNDISVDAGGVLSLTGSSIDMTSQGAINITGSTVDIEATGGVAKLTGTGVGLETTGALSIDAGTIDTTLGAANIVQRVHAGVGITVDNSDPSNPIVINDNP